MHLRHRSLIVLAGWSLPLIAAAQSGNPSIIPSTWKTGNCNIVTGMLKAECIPNLIGLTIQLVFGLISVFFLLNVIFAGYQIAMGSWTGDKSGGKDRLQWSIIGLIICVCSFLILDLVVTIITP